jgi:hypothetical protein
MLYFLSYRFYHPEAEKISNCHPEMEIIEPHKAIELHDIKCKLTFLSNPGEISSMLVACPPMIIVCDTAESQRNQLAIATIDINPLLEKEMVSNCHYFWTSVEFYHYMGFEREQAL